MAREFNPTFAISDKVILLNLHNAGLAKMNKFKEFEITLPNEQSKYSVQLCEESGGELINSGCKCGAAEPDKTTFANRASVYEIGYVLDIKGVKEEEYPYELYGQDELTEIDKQIKNAVLGPIKSYMKVFAGNDAVQDADIKITHFANIRKNALKRIDYSLLQRVVDGKPKGFGYALCRVMYSIGLQSK